MSLTPRKPRSPLCVTHKSNGRDDKTGVALPTTPAPASFIDSCKMKKVSKGNRENSKYSMKMKPKVVKHDCGAVHQRGDPYQSKQLPLTLKERWIDAGPRFEARRMYQQNLHGQRPPWATDEDLISDLKYTNCDMEQNSWTTQAGDRQRILRMLATRQLYKTPGTRSQATSGYVDQLLREMKLVDERSVDSTSNNLTLSAETFLKSQSMPNLFADGSQLMIRPATSLHHVKRSDDEDALSEDSLSEHESSENPTSNEVSKGSKCRPWALQNGGGDGPLSCIISQISCNTSHQSNSKHGHQPSSEIIDRKPFYPPGVIKHRDCAERIINVRKRYRSPASRLAQASSVDCLVSHKNRSEASIHYVPPQKSHNVTQETIRSSRKPKTPACVKTPNRNALTHANSLNEVDFKLFHKKMTKERSVSDIDLDVIFDTCSTSSNLPCSDEINDHISYWLKKNIYYLSNDSINTSPHSNDHLSRVEVEQKFEEEHLSSQDHGEKEENAPTFLSEKYIEISAVNKLLEDSLKNSDKMREHDHAHEFEYQIAVSSQQSQLNVQLVSKEIIHMNSEEAEDLQNDGLTPAKPYSNADSPDLDLNAHFSTKKTEKPFLSINVEENKRTHSQFVLESKINHLHDIVNLSDNSCLPKTSDATENLAIEAVNGSMIYDRSRDACFVCHNRVYQTDKFSLDDKLYHKSCFRCSKCHCILTILTYVSHENVLYCRSHYANLFILSAHDHGGKKYGISHENGKGLSHFDLIIPYESKNNQHIKCKSSQIDANLCFDGVEEEFTKKSEKGYRSQVANIEKNSFYVSNTRDEANFDKQLRPVTFSISNERVALNFHNDMDESTTLLDAALSEELNNTCITETVENRQHQDEEIFEVVESQLQNNSTDITTRENDLEEHAKPTKLQKSLSQDQTQNIKLPIDISKECARDTELAENTPQIRTDVVREADYIEVLPEPGTAKNVLNLWRTKESSSEVVTKEQRSFKHRTSLDGNAVTHQLNKNSQSIEVVRESDGPLADEMPPPNSAAERLALFRQMEAINGSKVPAVPSPLSAAKLAAKAREASGVNRNFFLPASQLPPPSSIESEQSQPRACNDETIENCPKELPPDVIRYGATGTDEEEPQIGITRNLRARFQQDS